MALSHDDSTTNVVLVIINSYAEGHYTLCQYPFTHHYAHLRKMKVTQI